MKPITIRNAVLFKDLSLDSKRPKLAILTIVFSIIMTSVAFIALLVMEIMGIYGAAISSRFLIDYFILFVWILMTMVFCIVPAITAGCISIEKERQTLEVLLTTRMTPWQIVKGKFLSAISTIIVLIIACVPSLAIIQIYGGVSMIGMLAVIGTLISSTVFFASIGVFCSALIKNTVLSVIATYVLVFTILFVTIGATVTLWLVSAAVGETLYEKHLIANQDMLNLEVSIYLLYINPLITVFDALGRSFGYKLWDSDTINGMTTIMHELGDWSETNISTFLWTPISIVIQLLASYGLLRLAGVCLNPLKRKRKHKKNVQVAK